MKNIFLIAFAALVLFTASSTYAASPCVSESDYISLEQQIKSYLRYPKDEATTKGLQLELAVCRAQVDAANEEMCEDLLGDTRHGTPTYTPKGESFCTLVCDVGYYKTSGGTCKENAQTRIDELEKEKERADDEEDALPIPAVEPKPVVIEAPKEVIKSAPAPAQVQSPPLVKEEAVEVVEPGVPPATTTPPTKEVWWQRVLRFFGFN